MHCIWLPAISQRIEKTSSEVMFERCYSFFHYCLLFCRYVMFQKRILSKPKWGAKAIVRRARPLTTDCARSDGTAHGQSSFFRRNVAAVASRWQHCVRLDRLKICTSDLQVQRRTECVTARLNGRFRLHSFMKKLNSTEKFNVSHVLISLKIRFSKFKESKTLFVLWWWCFKSNHICSSCITPKRITSLRGTLPRHCTQAGPSRRGHRAGQGSRGLWILGGPRGGPWSLRRLLASALEKGPIEKSACEAWRPFSFFFWDHLFRPQKPLEYFF